MEDQMKNTLKTEHPPRTEAPRLHRYEDPAESLGALVRYSPSANYLLLTENGESESYSKALSSKESVQWKKASIDNGGWCLTRESLARGVQFGTGRAVWHGACSLARVVQFGTDRVVWHQPEQFSSELNNISLV
ncbi:hypothetical protein Tco_1512329 [Tanacetum coccineum]